MNNMHRELARFPMPHGCRLKTKHRTLKRRLAGRRVVDLHHIIFIFAYR